MPTRHTPSSLRRSATSRPISAASATNHYLLTTNSSAFTLVELLVAMGIALVIIGFLVPAVMSSRTKADRARIGFDLQAIAAGLEAYKNDFRDYPRLANPPDAPISPAVNPAPPNVSGAQLLCWALLAPAPATPSAVGLSDGDGAGDPSNPANPGFGFRLRTTGQGQVYGPYIKPDAFKVGQAASDGTYNGPSASNNTDQIFDTQNHAILYYTANPNRANINVTSAFVRNAAAGPLFDPNYLYDPRQNLPMTYDKMQVFLGDANKNLKIDGTETALTTAPYILWSAGLDNAYGTADDVTSFQQ